MTANAKIRRAFRHHNEKDVMTKFAQTRAGQRATQAQVRAAARQLLQQLTAYVDRNAPQYWYGQVA